MKRAFPGMTCLMALVLTACPAGKGGSASSGARPSLVQTESSAQGASPAAGSVPPAKRVDAALAAGAMLFGFTPDNNGSTGGVQIVATDAGMGGLAGLALGDNSTLQFVTRDQKAELADISAFTDGSLHLIPAGPSYPNIGYADPTVTVNGRVEAYTPNNKDANGMSYTTGGVRIRASADAGMSILQFTNNPGVNQLAYIAAESGGRIVLAPGSNRTVTALGRIEGVTPANTANADGTGGIVNTTGAIRARAPALPAGISDENAGTSSLQFTDHPGHNEFAYLLASATDISLGSARPAGTPLATIHLNGDVYTGVLNTGPLTASTINAGGNSVFTGAAQFNAPATFSSNTQPAGQAGGNNASIILKDVQSRIAFYGSDPTGKFYSGAQLVYDYSSNGLDLVDVNQGFDITSGKPVVYEPLFAGSIQAFGDLKYSGHLLFDSDRRLKKEIKTLEGSLQKILALRGVSFLWKDKSKERGPQVGFIAQEVEKVFPQVVSITRGDTKGVDYAALVSPLVEAVKEQQAMIVGLQKDKEESLAMKAYLCGKDAAAPFCSK